MREFIFYSSRARTSGNIKDLMKAGRMDIAIHTFIHSIFISNDMRDITLHLIFDGPPDPPKHLMFIVDEKNKQQMKQFISKKDISGLIKRMLYKYKKSKIIEAFPNCFIEKKSLQQVIKDVSSKKQVYLLDKKGTPIQQTIKKIDPDNTAFLFADHEGFGRMLKTLKKQLPSISLGKVTYFASQVAVILNHWLDNL